MLSAYQLEKTEYYPDVYVEGVQVVVIMVLVVIGKIAHRGMMGEKTGVEQGLVTDQTLVCERGRGQGNLGGW